LQDDAPERLVELDGLHRQNLAVSPSAAMKIRQCHTPFIIRRSASSSDYAGLPLVMYQSVTEHNEVPELDEATRLAYEAYEARSALRHSPSW